MQCRLQEAWAPQGVLDNPQGLRRRAGISARHAKARCFRRARRVICTNVIRRIAEEWIKSYVVVRGVKAGVVKKIERLHVETQFEAFRQAEILEDRHVHARLKWTAENISAGSSETGFINVARPGCRIARRHAALTGRKQWNAESV